MLDPLTALSLAGNIVPFIDFGIKLVAKGHELYSSADGAALGHTELILIAKDVQELGGRLNESLSSEQIEHKCLKNSDVALWKLSEQCSGVAGELAEALDKLSVQGTSNRRWKSFRQALKSMMKKEEVDAITTRLQYFRDELNLHLLVSMKETIDMQAIRQAEGFRDLDQATQDLVKKLELDQGQLQLQQALKDYTECTSQGQDHTNELITSEHERTRRTILDSIQSSRVNQPLQNFGNFLYGDGKLKQVEKEILIESLLLESLRFPTMTNRYDEIESAHRKTYNWIFLPPDQQHAIWADFSAWLTAGAGIYWVNGKAASGKSTLMRFICDDSRTSRLLKHWSQGDKLTVLSYFFWNSGTIEQRSQVGLLRGLLFTILRRNKKLIPLVFPHQWAELQQLPIQVVAESSPQSWSLSKLSKALELAFQKAGEGIKFCLFIDGLDEYDGDPLSIIRLFTRNSKHPNVKICLSSRPLYDFVHAFRSCPALRLQDLTFNDIKQYVDDELGANDQMQDLQQRNPEEAPKLVLEIIDKADGVFLWVKLVVLSLLRGLRNSDEISDLQLRLRLLPPSLEELFGHILGRLEPVYLSQSSRIFQLFAASRTVEHPLTCLELSFAEECNAESLILSGSNSISETERTSRSDLVDVWLLTRCGGLIECHNTSPRSGPFRNLAYLHRTVRDFLELPQIRSRVLNWTMGTAFNPHRSLLQSIVLYLKLVVLPDNPTWGKTRIDLPLKLIDWALKHAYIAELDTRRAESLLLDELDKVMRKFLEALEPALYDLVTDRSGNVLRETQGVYSNESFLALTIGAGLYYYVAEKLEVESDILDKKSGRPLLQSAIEESARLIPPFNVSSRMVDLLFRHGACPNQIYKGFSAWQLILGRPVADPQKSKQERGEQGKIEQDKREQKTREQDIREQLKLICLFLQNGAFVNTNVYKSILERFERFESEHPKETKELQNIIVSKGVVLEHENHPEMIKIPPCTHFEKHLDGATCFRPRAAQSFMDSDIDFDIEGEVLKGGEISSLFFIYFFLCSLAVLVVTSTM